MSSIVKTRQSSSSLWLSAMLVLAGLIAFALAMPPLTGLHASLPKPIQQLNQRIDFSKAVADSLAGRAVIIDLRPVEIQKQKPVPGSAILLPKEPTSPKWEALAPLLESLKGTPVYVIFPNKDDHPAQFKLMSYHLDLWSVDTSP